MKIINDDSLSIKKNRFGYNDGEDVETILARISDTNRRLNSLIIRKGLILCYDDKDSIFFHTKNFILNSIKTLPNSFIEEFRNEYNKNNCITDSLIEDGLINDICIHVIRDLNSKSYKYYQSLENVVLDEIIENLM